MSEIHSYKLTIYEIGFADGIEISADEFRAIRSAMRTIYLGISIEEKFDLVLENFAELERECLGLAVEHSIFSGRVRDLLDEGRNVMNRRLSNLLSTAKLYVDQTLHELSSAHSAESFEYRETRKAISREYDTSPGYRVMEALRNYSQHRGLPIDAISFPMSRDDSATPPLLSFRVVPAVIVDELGQDEKFKAAVLDELRSNSDKQGRVPVLPLVREYVASIGRIQKVIRNIGATGLAEADDLIAAYRSRAESVFERSVGGLVAAACDADGLYLDREHLLNRPSERRKALAKKSKNLDALTRIYVSSRAD